MTSEVLYLIAVFFVLLMDKIVVRQRRLGLERPPLSVVLGAHEFNYLDCRALERKRKLIRQVQMLEELRHRSGWVRQYREEGGEKEKLGREISLLTGRYVEPYRFRFFISALVFMYCMGRVFSYVWGECLIPCS